MSGSSSTPAHNPANAISNNNGATLAPPVPAKADSFLPRVLESAKRLLTDNRPLALNLAFLATFWLLLFNRLHTEWVVNDLYSYGWAVPFLALFLFTERWRDRPVSTSTKLPAWWLILPAAVVIAYIPTRVINEANPDWVKINFYMTAIVVTTSFAALFSIGRFRYLWHFAFPLLFVYTALPWPVMVEENLVQTLTRWNTHVSADLLTFFGTPAVATGNLIQIGNSFVNVAEACSGIRSLQTAFMMSLFLGEFYRLGWLSRGLLMLSSFVAAFALNIGRTMTLTSINGSYGADTMESWHDTIGNIVMVGCLLSLWLLALGFSRLKKKYGAPGLIGMLTIGQHPLAEGHSQKVPTTNASPTVRAPFPTAFVIFGLFVLLVAEIGTESWYRYHEARLAPPPEWQINWPKDAPRYTETEFPDRTRAILKYNDATSASWIAPDGRHLVQMYCIRWLPGRVSKFLSGAHYPTVCLPATGMKFQRETGTFDYPAGPIDVRFTSYLFEAKNHPVYVFHAIVEDSPAPDGEKIDYRQVTSTERLESVMRGHRNLGQHVIGISIYGANSIQEAEHLLGSTLDGILHITPTHKKVAQR